MTPQEFTARFIDPWLNKLAIDPRFVIPICACVIGYKVAPLDNRGGGWQPGRVWVGRTANEKLFYNGAFFFRVMLVNPLGFYQIAKREGLRYGLLAVLMYLLTNLLALSLIALLWKWIWAPVFGYVGLGIRWSGKDSSKREFLQLYLPGWKLNGAFSEVFRVQSDVSAAEGFTAPNPNLSQGWFDGPK